VTEEALRRACDLIPKGARVVMSSKPIKKFVPAQQLESPDSKPRGLWYAPGDAWIKWVLSEMSHWRGQYVYEVRTTPRVKVVSTLREFDEFNERNGRSFWTDAPRRRGAASADAVDWREVSAEWDGIEISPYMWERRLEVSWYYGWDVASGCVWGAGGVAGIDLLLASDGREFVPAADCSRSLHYDSEPV